MPLGSPLSPLPTDAPVGPDPASLTEEVEPDSPLTEQLGLSRDLWVHERVDTTGGTTVQRVVLESPADVLEIAEYDGTVLYIGLGRHPSASSYDLKHPGGGELVKHIPPTSVVFIRPAAATATEVDVYAYGGRYAARLAG